MLTDLVFVTFLSLILYVVQIFVYTIFRIPPEYGLNLDEVLVVMLIANLYEKAYNKESK